MGIKARNFKSVLVTGGAGFVGSNLVRKLLPISEKVIIVDNLATGRYSNLKDILNQEKIDFKLCDIGNYKQIEQIMKTNQIEYIFHQAALSSVPRSFADPLATNRANITGTLNLLQLARISSVKKFVFASSSSVYGNSKKLPKSEDMKTIPLSPYAASKLSCELYAEIYNNNNFVSTTGLRYFNVFGPYQDPNSQYSAVIPIFIKNALLNKDITIFGDGNQSRDFTYVDNVCQANINAALSTDSNGCSLNISLGNRLSIRNLAEIIIEQLNSKSKIVFTKKRLGDVKHSIADISLAKKLINYEPRILFEDGIEKTIKYFKNLFEVAQN
ncbi:UDP-N-acetylglucosamine 4-epimerase [subsurface metagenome]